MTCFCVAEDYSHRRRGKPVVRRRWVRSRSSLGIPVGSSIAVVVFERRNSSPFVAGDSRTHELMRLVQRIAVEDSIRESPPNSTVMLCIHMCHSRAQRSDSGTYYRSAHIERC